ncbi:S5A_REDUCTASE domain-containing protein [Psidium guajava]|nr:S5A_REDUCTASE domain-containing protein [Psidium guajava]
MNVDQNFVNTQIPTLLFSGISASGRRVREYHGTTTFRDESDEANNASRE